MRKGTGEKRKISVCGKVMDVLGEENNIHKTDL